MSCNNIMYLYIGGNPRLITLRLLSICDEWSVSERDQSCAAFLCTDEGDLCLMIFLGNSLKYFYVPTMAVSVQ